MKEFMQKSVNAPPSSPPSSHLPAIQSPFSSIPFWPTLITVASILAMVLHFTVWPETPLMILLVLAGFVQLTEILWKAAKGDFGADLLAALALVTAAWQEQHLAAALVILMLSSGAALESYATAKASFVLRALAARMPSKAHRVMEGGEITEITIESIAIGYHLQVLPHEVCPVDGTVISGHGDMDESYLTGEPYHIAKAVGSKVLSGAINGNFGVVVRADALPTDSRYAKITQVMSEAETRRPRLRRLADSLGAWYTPLALLVALAAWYFSGDSTRFLAVLVVATPCPLLIAIPVTIISAISLAAKRGIIIRDPVVLERLPTCRTAIFDKTGTLTNGKPELADIITAKGFDRQNVLQVLASMERYSKHPLASAIIKAAETEKLAFLPAEQIEERPGSGLYGRVGGHEIMVSNRRTLEAMYPDQMAAFPPADRGLECMVVINNTVAAACQFWDKPRSDGHSFIGHLAPSHGFEKIMLVSGDRSSEVEYLASLLEIATSHADQTPEQKLEIVRTEVAKAPTLFMGDGINDAPAMAAATVGIAFGQGSAVTSEAAGAVILESSLVKVDELLHISMSMRSIALQSAIGGMALSIIGIAFAVLGHLTPVQGAVLQEVIDVIAILNALRMTLQKTIHTDIP